MKKEFYLYECGCYVIIILASAFQLALTEDRCRTLQFKGTDFYSDSAFTTNIIQTTYVQDENQCKIACFVENSCKSYNLGPPQGGGEGKRVCELSSSLHHFHLSSLVPRPGFIYRPSVNLCGAPCADNKTCYPDNGDHSCFCTDPGFTGDACAEDIDECAANTHDCAAEANCTNSEGSYTCICVEGFEGNGKACQDIDECSRGTHNCQVQAMCGNTVGSFTCSCPSGQILVGNNCVVFLAHWILDGTDSSVTLRGTARFVEQNGRTVLYLDGAATTFAETPAIPFRQTDFTIAVWIKFVSSVTTRQVIYADWSTPFQFMFQVTGNQLIFNGRRDVEGRDTVVNIRTLGDPLQSDVWMHVTMTWRRSERKARLFVNGVMKKEVVAADNPNLDFKNTGHSVYDIGLKRDSAEAAHAYFSDLMIFNRDLSVNEIANDLFHNHPLRAFV